MDPRASSRFGPLLCLGVVSVCLGTMAAQAPSWRTLTTTLGSHPGPGAMVYDDLRDRTVFFGGGTGYTPHSGIRELDGETWADTQPGGGAWPPARFGHAMAFDSRRGEAVMHGGSNLGPFLFTDTWRWNGSTWSQAAPTNTPPPMFGHAMAYDERRDRIVLFGHETWEWDGSDWSQRMSTQSPGRRVNPAMAYDARRARTILFGGTQLVTQMSDTWEWDGTDWSQVATSGLQPTAIGPVMAFDRERARTLLVGSLVGGVEVAYEFDGTGWTPVAAPLTPRNPALMVYDRQRGRMVLFTSTAAQHGNDVTRVYEATGMAVAQPYGVACGAPALRAVEDPSARPVLGGTLGVDVTDVPAGLAFMCFGWSNRTALQFSLPLRMADFGLPGCWLLQSDDAITLPCLPTGASTARFSMAIPSHPSFVGLRFFVQPWAPAPGMFAPIHAVIGNAVAATIGSF